MEINDKIAALEAILFACGEPVEIYRLSQASGVDVGTVPSLIKTLNERYDSYHSGIRIIRLDSSFQMCTRAEYAMNIKNAIDTKRSAPLSNAAMEVLTIIAYNQPVSKPSADIPDEPEPVHPDGPLSLFLLLPDP